MQFSCAFEKKKNSMLFTFLRTNRGLPAFLYFLFEIEEIFRFLGLSSYLKLYFSKNA